MWFWEGILSLQVPSTQRKKPSVSSCSTGYLFPCFPLKALHQNRVNIQQHNMLRENCIFVNKFIWRQTKRNCCKNIPLCPEASSHLKGSWTDTAVYLPWPQQSKNPWQREKCSFQKILNWPNICLWLNHLSVSPEISRNSLMLVLCLTSELETLPLLVVFGFAVTPVC